MESVPVLFGCKAQLFRPFILGTSLVPKRDEMLPRKTGVSYPRRSHMWAPKSEEMGWIKR